MQAGSITPDQALELLLGIVKVPGLQRIVDEKKQAASAQAAQAQAPQGAEGAPPAGPPAGEAPPAPPGMPM
jgi:hypothetical protein